MGDSDNSTGTQVKDDIELLDLMLADQQKQPAIYGTTNYYSVYDTTTIPYIRQEGLTDYRTKSPLTFSTFAARDEKMAPLTDVAQRRLIYFYAKQYPGPASSARPITELGISQKGNPEDYFEVEGNWYTPRSLVYYMRYGYVGRFVDWSGVRAMAELGPGSGYQAEVIAKLNPNVALLLFDIPPQLYICESYLKAVFGGRVVSFRETRKLKSGFRPEPGRIYIFGNWQMEFLRNTEIDLFWDAATLYCTEPEVTENYLGIVNAGTAKTAYLLENFDGFPEAPKPGERGVMRRTTMENYVRALSNFTRADYSEHIYEDSQFKHLLYNTVWRRKA